MRITVEHPNSKVKAKISDESGRLALLLTNNGQYWDAIPINPQALGLIKAVIAKYEETLGTESTLNDGKV